MTVSKWTPFGVALDITATVASVTRKSATQYTVNFNVSWETYYSGAQTNYGMTAASGGVTHTISAFNGTKRSSGSGSFTGTYSISGNAGASKSVVVTFRNFNTDNGDSATKAINLSVSVPAWTSYTVKYNANGGSGAPSSQTKWKDQALTLSTTKPTRTGYSFQGWATSASGSVAYAAGASYTANAAVTLYAVWKANTYTVSYNANGGSGAPASQTKTYGTALTLSGTKPTRTNYTFKGWGTSASATTVSYAAGASYTANAAITLYAVWELAYIKPRITNFTVKRCNASGTVKDDGTYALVSFTWACDKAVSSILIKWKLATAESYGSSHTVTASGTSGTVSQVIGGGVLSGTSSYTIQVTVADSIDSAEDTRTLNSLSFTMHGKPGGDGIAFGKTSELGAEESLGGNGVADFAFDAKFNQPVYGKALGMDRLPAIPANSDFNDYMEPGCYAVQSNAIAASCANIPVDRAGRLEVWSATGEGVRLEQWSYLRQRFIPYNSGNAVWERELTRGEDNVWNYYDWWQSSLTPAASEKVYSKAAMTIALSANTVLGAVNTYTRIPFDKAALSTNSRLTLSSNSIRIGSNIQHIKVSGQVLVSPGSTNGLRHIRIQKVSGGTTTSVGWITVYVTASHHTIFPLTPVIVSVKEGDLLNMVFYTGNSSDSISSGSASNGWQTFLTVEEL
jgi:uncharacterized repeat protein (TIGR02543 family)